MSNFVIYESGGMQSFGKDNFNQSNDWRVYCKKTLENCDSSYRVKVFNPNEYFNFCDVPQYKSEDEIMRFDLYNLRNSDLVITNFNDPKSMGTMAEMAIAYDRRIPIIGLNADTVELHPWQKCMCERIFTDVDEMLDYIEDFYLR